MSVSRRRHPVPNAPPLPQDKAAALGLRLNKAIAAAGICSRRKADELILAGAVSVNGATVATPGVIIDPENDCVEVAGKRIRVPSSTRTHEYILLHKPTGVMTTTRDPQGRRTVYDLLPPWLRDKRPVHVGRLDYASEGLLLLTTDGELAHRLTHPRHHLPKVYHVTVRGRLPAAALEAMRAGMLLADGAPVAPVGVKTLSTGPNPSATRLEMTLIQGLNRQIRRMLEVFGFEVLVLQRVAQGPVRLGELPLGGWRPLTPAELTALQKAVGLAP